MSQFLHRRQLEDKMEGLRTNLHRFVGDEPSRLRDAQLLSLSKKLDVLIVRMQQLKQS